MEGVLHRGRKESDDWEESEWFCVLLDTRAVKRVVMPLKASKKREVM